MLDTIKIWWLERVVIPTRLDELGSLERHSDFITPFFLGESQYKYEIETHGKRLDTAKIKYEKAVRDLEVLKSNKLKG